MVNFGGELFVLLEIVQIAGAAIDGSIILDHILQEDLIGLDDGSGLI